MPPTLVLSPRRFVLTSRREREKEREREAVVSHPWVLTIIKKRLTRGKGWHFFYRRAAEIGRVSFFKFMICEFYTSIGIILSYAILMSHIARSTTHLLPRFFSATSNLH